MCARRGASIFLAVSADELPAARIDPLAVRDRREQVIAALTEHFARDVLDVEEFERRLDVAHRASAVAELDALLADLGPLPTSAALVPRPSEEALARWPAEKRWFAILGGVDRRGKWQVPRRMQVVCVMGGGVLDFREAEFAPGVTELHVVAFMGGLEIVVPPWLAVECDGTAIMGGFEARERGRGEPDPGRGLLRVTGFVMMGGVEIQTRMPGESKRQARKRLKQEKKQLAAGSRAALKAAREDERG